MKTIPHLGKALILLFFTLMINSCGKNDDNGGPNTDDDNAPTAIPNIIELAKTVDVLSTLVDALEDVDPDLLTLLEQDGEFTVFAPTNDAFNELLDQLEAYGDLDDFDEDAEKELLAKIIKYHVVSGSTVFFNELSNGQLLETLQGESIEIAIDGNTFIKDKTDDTAEVVSSDNDAFNGVVHIIDKILLPQEALDVLFPKPTVIELIVNTDELALLNQAITTAGLDDDLANEGPFTIFAPTNGAIEELFDLLGDSFNSFDDFDNFLELQILEQILLYHVVPQNLMSSDLVPGPLTTLSDGETIEIISSGDTFVVGDASEINANLVDPNKEASNGVVHSIDKILIPQEVQDFLDTLNPNDPSAGIPTIKEYVETTEELAFLEEALEITGLLDTLGDEGPYTVFVPTSNSINLIFGLLGNSITSLDDIHLDFEIELLRKILSYHVVPGIITSNDLAIGNVSTLLSEGDLEIGRDGGSFFLKDGLGSKADLVVTDIPAGNGVIHTINRILIPETVIETIVNETEQTLIEVLDNLEGHDLFASALFRLRNSFENVLNGNEFTFFLPTNKAFLELFSQLDGIDSLEDFDTEEEIRLLGKILAYHCVDGIAVSSSSLNNNQELITFQGEKLNIIIDDSIYILDKSDSLTKITSPDIEVLNGTLHIIDKVLLPQEVLSYL